MRFLLDANAVILALTGHALIRDRLMACEEGDLGVSSIAFAEVFHGTARGKPPAAEIMENFIEQVAVLPFDAEAARIYAKLPFKRGSFDRLIAAHALALNVTLITNNEADFADIPGLRIENWTK